MAFSFINTGIFWLLFLGGGIALGTLFLFFSEKYYKTFLGRFHPKMFPTRREKRFWYRRIRETLFFLSILFLGIVLLRPVGGESKELARAEGIDAIFVVDVSQSMRALDFSDGRKNIDRLEMSKRMIRKFVEEHPENRYGLIIFAGEAFTVSPLTFDHDTFLTFVDGISPDDIVQQGTNLEDALHEMTDRFLSAPNDERGRLGILVTDGEEQKGDYQAAAKNAQKNGITLVTIGIGSEEGSRIPEGTDFYGNIIYKTHQGEVVLTHLNEAPLKEIAKLTNGTYLHPTSESEFLAIADTIDTLKKTTLEAPISGTERPEQYRPFAILSFLCFLLALLLPFPKSSHRSLLFLLITPLVFSGCSVMDAPFAYVTHKGNSAFAQKNWEQADVEYQTAENIAPSDETATAEESRGLVAFEKEDYKNAKSLFQKAEESCPPENKHCTNASYHLGNTLYRLGEKSTDFSEKKENWQNAITAYDRALSKNQNDREAKENKEFVQKKLEELEKEDKQNQEQNGKNQKNKEDQQKDGKQEEQESEQEGKNGEQKDGKSKDGSGGEGEEEKLSEETKQQIEQYLQELNQTEKDADQFFNRFGQEKQNAQDPFGNMQQDPFFQQFFQQDPFFQDQSQTHPNEKDW